MTNQHTLGPWFYDDSIKGRLVINSEHSRVAVMPYLAYQAQANARLIAAAPELLAALKLALSLIEDHQETPPRVERFKQARDAIAKAENGGRS